MSFATQVFQDVRQHRTRAEWLAFINHVVSQYGNKLLDRKAVYEEASRRPYLDRNGNERPNPWLFCAGWAVGDIGSGVVYIKRLKPYYSPGMQELMHAKTEWIKTVNREIWIHWIPGSIVMQSGVAPESHPLFEDLTPEWKLAAQICWDEGANSYNGCASHSYAEQSAIERVSAFGPAGPHYFGPHSYDPLGLLHIKMGSLRILDWHAPLQLPGFALRDRGSQYRDWRVLRDRIEYVVGTCCTSCSNNVMKKGSQGVCCDQKPRSWDGIIDGSFASMVAEPVSGWKIYDEHPRLGEYRNAIAHGKLEGRYDSPLFARYMTELDWQARRLSPAEFKVARKEAGKRMGIGIGTSLAKQAARDVLPGGSVNEFLSVGWDRASKWLAGR